MNIDLIPDRKEYTSECIKYGFVDKNGNLKIPYMYEFAMPFSSELAAVRNYDNHFMGFIDCNNNVVIDFLYDFVYPFYGDSTWMQKNGLWGLVSKDSNLLIDYSYKKASPFKNDVAIVQRTDNKWGLIDKLNNPVSSFKYDWLMSKDNVIFDAFMDGEWIKLNIDEMKNVKILKVNK